MAPRNLTPDPFPHGKGNQIEDEKGKKKDEEVFPHLYGALNVDAVVKVVELVWEEDRGFRMAEGMPG